MSQISIKKHEGIKIINELKRICEEDDIIRNNRFFWKITQLGKEDCYMIQRETKDYYGVSDAIKIYRNNGVWTKEEIQCLRNIKNDKHVGIYNCNKKIYIAVYKIV